MTLNFLPAGNAELKPRITVIGVGGAGGNAVNNMIQARLEGVEFICANTDAQALSLVRTENRIQLGLNTTRGLGAGSRPPVGRAAAEESMQELTDMLTGANMVFITAGMGGGTGTGAAPVIAQAARDMGVLTVGVVTKPFHFEGPQRMRTAEAGIEELSRIVDTLIIIPNQNLFRIATERTTFADAFKMADDVLHSGVRGVTDLMVMPGLINLDFADIRCVMSEMGKAMMGTGEASGDKRALEAAEAAISNPLLDDTSMKGAKGVLINITGGMDMTLFEVDEAANRIREEVDSDANIIFGSTFDEKLNGVMRVSVVATGIAQESSSQQPRQPSQPTLVAASPQVATMIKPQAPAAPPQAPAITMAAAPAQPRQMTQAAGQSPSPGYVRDSSPMQQRPMASAPMQNAPVQHAPVDATRPRETELSFQPEARPAAVHQDPLIDRTEPSFDRSSASQPMEAPDMSKLNRAISDITSDHRNRTHAAPVPQQEEPRRTPSLFDRLMASRAKAQEPSLPPARSAQPDIEPRMTGLASRQEPVARPAEDDLDIPAFLRRHAN